VEDKMFINDLKHRSLSEGEGEGGRGMTQKYFLQLADYNVWANDIVHSWFDKISDEQWNQPLVSSFETIEATALHVAGSETIWLDRLNKVGSPIWLPAVFKGSKNEIINLWKKTSADLKVFVENLDETKMESILRFTRLNGITYEMPHYQVLAHVFNHSSYHRGQLVTLLRQVGFTDVSSTDLSGFFSK
jgi:uncharacterized damage-inducible protein DinB